MKKINWLFLALLPVILSHSLSAQNEWIDFSQTYYKFNVWEDNVYQIPFDVLSEMGLSDDPSGYHLYRMGEEIPIYFSTENNLQNGDFLAISPNYSTQFSTKMLSIRCMVNPWAKLCVRAS